MSEFEESPFEIQLKRLIGFVNDSGLFNDMQLNKLREVMVANPEMVSRVETIFNISKRPGEEDKKSYGLLLENLRGNIDTLMEVD